MKFQMLETLTLEFQIQQFQAILIPGIPYHFLKHGFCLKP